MWIVTAAFLLTLGPQDDQVRLLIEKLRSDKAAEREHAVLQLRKLGDEARPELEKVVRDPDSEVAARAGQLLRFFAVRERMTPALRKSVPEIEDLLFSGNDGKVTEILLGNYPIGGRTPRDPYLQPADLDVLAPAAVRGASTSEARLEICWALQHWQLKSGAGELVAYLREPRHRGEVIKTLGIIGNQDTIPELVPYLIDPEYLVRDAAAEALVKLGGSEIVLDRSLELLRHRDGQIRGQAAYRLGTLGSTKPIPLLVEVLADDDMEVRRGAVRSLARLVARDRVPDLLKIMRGPSGPGQCDAAQAIAWIDAREAIPELITMLQDPSRSTGGEAARALGSLQAREAVDPLRRLVGHKDVWIREQAIYALGLIGDPAAMPDLLKGLEDPVDYVALTTLYALWHLQAKEAAPHLVPLLRDRPKATSLMREYAAVYLAGFGAVDAVPRILPLLQDGDDRVRRGAVEALGRLDVQDAVPALEKLVSNEKLGAEAVLALARMGRKAAVEPLLKRKEPSFWGERRRDRIPEDEMLFAMNRFGHPAAFSRLASVTVRRMDNRAHRKSSREVIREMEKRYGLRMEIDRSVETAALDKVSDWPECQLTVTYLSDFLQREADGQILLVEDRVILVSEEKALAHWKAWWAAEQKK